MLTLGTVDRPAVAIPLTRANGTPRDVTVWRSEVRGFDEGEEAARWLSRHLDRDVRLVRFDRAKPRQCNPDYVKRLGRAHALRRRLSRSS